MPAQLGIGMIGCGEIAVASAKAFAQAPNARIAMVMDVDAGVAQDLGKQHGVPWTTSHDELLAGDGVEAVYVATPHFLHAPLGIKAAQAGKHVMVEKPIATTLDDADALIAACDKAGVALSVAFCMRNNANAIKAKELIEAGAIGDVFGVHIQAISDKPESYWTGGFTGRIKTQWRKLKAESGGGILIMNAVHNIDRIHYVTGLKPLRVFAEAGTFATAIEVEDMIGVSVRYDSGAVGVIEGTSCAPGRVTDPHDRIYGTKGQILLSDPLKVYLKEPAAGIKAGKWIEVKGRRVGSARADCFDAFAQAVLEGKPQPITGADGRLALALIRAAYESAESHAPVSL